jgi:hypothetical protein
MKKRRSRRTADRNKKSRVVASAMSEFIKREKAKEFGKLLLEGAFDYPATNEEIERAQG